MKLQSIGHANLAAVTGAMIGSMTGLIAVGVAPTLITGDTHHLFRYPSIGLCCFLLGGPIGWILGGQLGPLFQRSMKPRKSHLVGGSIGGLIPFAVFVIAGWYLFSPV